MCSSILLLPCIFHPQVCIIRVSNEYSDDRYNRKTCHANVTTLFFRSVAVYDYQSYRTRIHIGIALHGSTTLTELTLADCSIEARSVSKLVDAIGDIPTLKIFDLSCNAVGSEGVKHLGE